jgi:hypothetical protein
MKFSRWFLRVLSPICERERMEMRLGIARMSAFADDVKRTIEKRHAVDTRRVQAQAR